MCGSDDDNDQGETKSENMTKNENEHKSEPEDAEHVDDYGGEEDSQQEDSGQRENDEEDSEQDDHEQGPLQSSHLMGSLATNVDTPLYTPLDAVFTSFRLIRVRPGTHDGMIDCQLRIASMQMTTLQYKALSYQWGQDDGSYRVRLDGHIVNDGKNLYSFL